MTELTQQQIRIVTTSFGLLPIRHRERADVHQLAWQYLFGRRGTDWNNPKSIRSAARNAILDAAKQSQKRHSIDKRLTVNSLELERLDPPAPDVARVEACQFNYRACVIARVHAIPRPGEPDVAKSHAQMLLRVKTVRNVRANCWEYDAAQYSRVRRQACRLAVETGSVNVLSRAKRLARIEQIQDKRKAEKQAIVDKQNEAEKQANRANFRLRRMLRELLAQ